MIRGIKSSIVFNTAFLLLIGMILVYFATTITAEQQIIKTISRSGFQLIDSLPDCSAKARQDSAPPVAGNLEVILKQILPTTPFEGIILHNEQRNLLIQKHPKSDRLSAHTEEIFKKIKIGTRETWSQGSMWANFWQQGRYLIISSPINNGGPYRQAALIFDLKNIYDVFRWSQKGIFIYIVINTFILTAIASYRLYRIYLRPLKRLIRRAEEYNDSDDALFKVRKEDNELHSLSRALNQLVTRISKDKDTLSNAVVALEKANRELKNAQQEVIRAEKLASVGRLSSGIAHEIGNPIGIVMGYLELLKNPALSDADKRDFIERTGNEIERINRIIQQLLDLSRPVQESNKPITVHELIQDLHDVVKVQPFMANINLVLELFAERDVIQADSGQLRQVFLNILINAVDAMQTEGDHQGIVCIKTKNIYRDDQTIWMDIVFEDNGSGIDSEAIDTIFDPFFTTKEPGKGTGLGLSVCYMIVDQLGGTLKVSSQPGNGTRMSILLPVIVEHGSQGDP